MEKTEAGEKERTALVAGATGLVGSHIVRLLSLQSSISEVRAISRRSLAPSEKRPRVRECIVDFGRLEEKSDTFAVDLVFSALGTTMHAAGSGKAFRTVDFEYQLAVAEAARSAGARHFLLVSAIGANRKSPFLYNRVKGEIEEAVCALGYPSVTIARPSLLLGERPERRFGEELAKRFEWMLPAPWAGVDASQVAAALVHAAVKSMPGTEILKNADLRKFPRTV